MMDIIILIIIFIRTRSPWHTTQIQIERKIQNKESKKGKTNNKPTYLIHRGETGRHLIDNFGDQI